MGTFLVVVEEGNHRIQVFDADGNAVRVFGEEGISDGQFKNPYSLAVDGTTLYVSEKGNHRVQSFKLV